MFEGGMSEARGGSSCDRYCWEHLPAAYRCPEPSSPLLPTTASPTAWGVESGGDTCGTSLFMQPE